MGTAPSRSSERRALGLARRLYIEERSDISVRSRARELLWRLPGFVFVGQVGSAFKEQPDHGRVSLRSSCMQRRPSVVALGGEPGPVLQEQTDKACEERVVCERNLWEILVEQQPPQGVLVCDHAGLVINKFSPVCP